MLQLCRVTDCLSISNARSACSGELLRRGGVTLCINVSQQQPFADAPAVRRVRVPVRDAPDQDLFSHFDCCAYAIREEGARGGHAVVYCKNGRSRSATVCAAYLMKHHGLSLANALQVGNSGKPRPLPPLNTRVLPFQKVKMARQVIDPNPGFLTQLRRYEEELGRR